MNKRIVVFLTLVAALAAGCGNPSAYEISGSLPGLADGTVVQLTPLSHQEEKAIQEAVVKDGRFTMQGQCTEPLCVLLSVRDSLGSEAFMLENARIAISADVENQPAGNGHVMYQFRNFKVSGSPLSDKLEGYKARRAALNEDYSRVRALSESGPVEEARVAESAFFQKVRQTTMDIIGENKDSYWGPMMAIYLMTYFTKSEVDLFRSFSEEARQSHYGRMMKAGLPGADIGTEAGVLSLIAEDGQEFSLDDMCRGKKYVLIDFWASWCNPCRKEIPNVKAQYEKYADKGFEVVSISIDKNEAAWKKAVQDEKLVWPNFLDRTGAADAYGVTSIPAMFLIEAASKTIVASSEYARGEELAAKLAELFK